MKTNRYLVAAAGIIFHLMIGSVYAWSVFTNPIAKQTGWAESSVAFAFSIAIFFLGLSAAFMGRAVEKFGPRLTGTLASFLYGTGTIMTGLAIHQKSLWLLYIAYGVIGGLGLGSGYVTPVSTIIKWFPDKRGLSTGLAIMGFGFAALLTGPIAQQLMVTVGLEQTFYLLGAADFIVMLVAAQFIVRPRTTIANPAGHKLKSGTRLTTGPELTANQALKTKSFVFLWIMFFINITCGIGLVSAASPMAQSMTGMSVQTAAVMVGIIGLFNGFGRLVWATLSDYIGRPATFSAIFIINVAMLTLLLSFQSQIIFVSALCLLLSCYGAGFSVIPAYLGDVFGTKELGAVHGYVLTAWAAAGIVGPVLLSLTHQLFHNYTLTLIAFIVIDLLALVVSFLIRRNFALSTKLVDSEL
ncbi:OFA family MFS transporter [Liquorilactobacillus satsumensis]|uniref:L-lactate MFS transporter n=1 Tax=Liquorilactobacillus satsumensis TaxID=259059 RepID=UPI001E4AE132|nr:OFA family MFS transporter [Liquorilactobacillus satsumensis]MCC7666102.1 MFS transporter [Liquorilactobacillus satsumensis]MCP9356791.1 OFA family MFS transporter [Liquorilactobacillus satsumensis]MCP9370731.1 OFA family MFS transporter [Liquorilactobacillus satsumensis]